VPFVESQFKRWLPEKRMTKHIGIVACSAEGAALCYRTLCKEAPAARVASAAFAFEVGLAARYVLHG